MRLKHNILLAAANDRACAMMKELIYDEECSVVTATDGTTLRCIDLSRFDIIIISMPLANESGIELTDDLREKTDVPLIALVKAERAASVYEKIRHTGAYIVEKPLGKGSLMQAIRFIEMHADNEAELRQKLCEERKNCEELKVMFRAKLVLIEKCGMSEDDAHKFIQQRAMNERKSLTKTAEAIISEYSGSA